MIKNTKIDSNSILKDEENEKTTTPVECSTAHLIRIEGKKECRVQFGVAIMKVSYLDF